MCESMSGGFGVLPVRFRGLMACGNWAVHVADWCVGVRYLDGIRLPLHV